jgi:cysteine synthase B
MAIRLSHEEGLLAGISAGAAIQGSMQIAKKLDREQEAVIVAILPDSGDKYLSERFWTER